MAPHILQDRVVVVTGASGGVGRAVVRELGAKGAKVALVARGAVGLGAAAVDVGAAGGIAQVYEADVADYEQVRKAAERIEAELGPIDVWINAASSSVSARFTDISPEEYERTTAVTYLGCVWGTRVALELMRPRNRGTIVQTGSALAHRSVPLRSAYCGAEHGIRGFTESLRTELLAERSGIRVTTVQLPAMNAPRLGSTPSQAGGRPRPKPPVHQPEVAARGIVHAAAHPERKEYWVGAGTAAVLMAQRVAPALVDHYLARTAGQPRQSGEQPAGDAANLWEPVEEVPGHDDSGHHHPHARSLQLWLSQHRRAVLLTLAAAGAVASAAVTRKSSR
ncbi:SDR family oxidoreductase [Nonomuraea sp. MCN248]|uniref:SDR family oxidoreductase n=1 Tax=Nonomuraea corallina TaxID=2989783 RepID=A0ABT4SFL9_9ACTN|nr:SDR family oxidoreductase [Nonomuraea corallina]MDA0635992.1 SDR family oxidoreductase [Nonomuraea corallina]